MEKRYQIDETVIGEVVGLKPYGAFVKLPNEETGMVHISEVAEEYVKEIGAYLEIGQQVVVKVIGMHQEGKYNLSLRNLTKQDQESAHFSKEVEEARQVLETRREAIMESVWKRPIPEPTSTQKNAHTEILSWIQKARQVTQEASRRSESRQRSITSIDI